MDSSLRLFWTGLSVLALGVASCSSTTVPLGVDGGGGTGGPTDGPKTDGPKTDGGPVDAQPDVVGIDRNVPPPAMLTATVRDRRATTFDLLWTAPANGTAAVSGYQVRYAKVPITATNFDDTTVTTAATYIGTPAAPGDTDGTVVKAYIENGYYFAVTGTDAGGAHVGAFMATDAAVTAHFNVTTIPSVAGTNEDFGYSISGDGDLNGDGLSDVLVGTSAGAKAYLFFGGTNFAPTAPSVVFSGTGADFGSSVAQIGDIDGDGLPDIAISDPYESIKVYIYKGRRTWPLTLTDAQADYVISGDSTYTASALGSAITRIGDFTGDGIDDFAIGARNFGTFVGRVIIIPGKASGFASVTLPDATKSIVIDGDSTLGRAYFGYSITSLGHFYSISTGTTMVVGSPGTPSSATANAGHVYAFHGQTGTSGVISLATADHMIAGPASPAEIGIVVSNLGPLLGTTPSLGIGNPGDSLDVVGATGTAFVTSGTPTTGPLSSKIVLHSSVGTQIGAVVLGGGLPGQDTKLSLIGDSTPDLLVGAEAGSLLTISDGAKLGTKTSPIDVALTAEVAVPLATGWSIGAGESSLIRDINGDGYPDFAIGKAVQPGAIAVYW